MWRTKSDTKTSSSVTSLVFENVNITISARLASQWEVNSGTKQHTNRKFILVKMRYRKYVSYANETGGKGNTRNYTPSP